MITFLGIDPVCLDVVPPDPVKIYDEEGVERMTFVGPYLEGQDARLTCTAFGGQFDPEVETPNNFCPSIFSQVFSDLHFLQIANLDTQTCPDSLKCVRIFSSVSLHFHFLQNANLDTCSNVLKCV